MIQNKKISPEICGTILSAAIIIFFCRITINGFEISLDNKLKIIFITILHFVLFCFSEKKSIVINKNSIITYIYLILLSGTIISCFFSTNPTESLYRTILILYSSTSFFFFTMKIKNPIRLMNGFSLGIIIITSFSIAYSLAGIIYDNSYIAENSKELIIITIGGFDFSQIISNRKISYAGTEFFIQRYAGIIPNPNGLGLVSAIMLSFSFNVAYSNRFRKFILLLSLTGMVISFSRMGILLFSFSLLYMAVKNNKLKSLICSVSVLILFLFLIHVSHNGTIATDLTNKIPALANQEAFQIRNRTDLMVAAWEGFKHNWLFGVGYGVGAEYLFPDSSDTQAVHSVFLNALLETGIVGTIPLIALWLLPVFSRNGHSTAQDASSNMRQMIAAIMFGLFFAEAFDLSVTRFHYIHLIFFFLLGIWSSLRQESKETIPQNVQSSETQRMHQAPMERMRR